MLKWVMVAGVAAAVMAGQPSYAAKLLGEPIVMATDTGGFSGAAFETSKGDIGVAYSNFQSDTQVRQAYLQFLNKGGLKGERVVAVDASADGARFMAASVMGALPLDEGRSAIYFRGDPNVIISWDEVFYGQTMKRSRTAGNLYSFKAIDQTIVPYSGAALQLASRKVVIYWGNPNIAGQGGAAAQFVDATGAFDGSEVDITRAGYDVLSVSNYLDGFVVAYIRRNFNGFANVVAQKFDALANKVGTEHQIEARTNTGDAYLTRAYGLADGSVLVVRFTYGKKTSSTISAEVLDADWNVKTPRTVLKDRLYLLPFTVASLPDGNFMLGLDSSDFQGGNYEATVSTYGQDLQRIGKAARILTPMPATVDQIITRSSGDAFVVYGFNPLQGQSRNLVGQFVKP